MKRVKNNTYWVAVVFVIIILGIFLFFKFQEDDWIKNENGIWVKHGNPTETPNEVLEQQETINCAYDLFKNFSGEIGSQCLGICGNYSVDLVNVPRTSEDSLVANQCWDYIEGKTSNFIELDKEMNVVRIV